MCYQFGKNLDKTDMQKKSSLDQSQKKFQNNFIQSSISNGDAYELKKDIVLYVLRQSLLESGETIFEMVNRSLLEKYGCGILDSFEKPEYLSDVLKYVYGGSYQKVVESIKKNLNKFSHESGIKEFVEVLEASS